MPHVLQTTPRNPRRPALKERARSGFVSARRFLGNLLTQDKVTGSLKTLAWVAPLTILIWVYAEREQLVATTDPIPIPITVTSADAKMVVTLLRPAEGVILADLSGPRSQLDAARQQLGGTGGIQEVGIVVDKLVKGLREIPTAAALENDPLFTLRGIRVSNCQPAVLQVYVDEYEDRELPVAAPPSFTNLVAAPIFEPATVKVRAPKRAWEKAPIEGPLQALANLASIADLATPREHKIPAVRVFVPGLSDEPNVSITPATVKATLEVRQPDRQLRLPSMVVFPSGPAFLLKQYRVACPDVINNVNVVGPPDKIAMLERPDYPKPWALLEVSRDDATGAFRKKRLRFMDLPDLVQVMPEDAQREVEFKLVPITGEQ